jgi:uncharacterized membrane protein
VTELIGIGYDGEETAIEVLAQEAHRLTKELKIEPEATAVVARDPNGKYKVITNHHPVVEGASWAMLWGVLFGMLFFVPVLGLAVGGALGALFTAIENAGIDKEFQQQVSELLQPGTSALFLIVDEAMADGAIEVLSGHGGRTLRTSLSKDVEQKIQQALYSSSPANGSGDG